MRHVQTWGYRLGILKALVRKAGLEAEAEIGLDLKKIIPSLNYEPKYCKIYFQKYRPIISIPRFKRMRRKEEKHGKSTLHS